MYVLETKLRSVGRTVSLLTAEYSLQLQGPVLSGCMDSWVVFELVLTGNKKKINDANSRIQELWAKNKVVEIVDVLSGKEQKYRERTRDDDL